MVTPAPRPREGQGKRFSRGGLVPSCFGVFDGFFWQPQGHRDPLGLSYPGRGRFLCPLTGPFSHCPRAAPRNPQRTLGLRNVWLFVYGLGGNAVRFFLGVFFGDCPPSFWVFFRVLSILGFFLGRFFGTNFGMGVRGFLGCFFGHKNARFASRKRRRESSPCLRFFFGVLFLLRRVFAEGFGQ